MSCRRRGGILLLISMTGPVLVGSVALGLIGAGVFIADPLNGYSPGVPMVPSERTVHGRLHDLLGFRCFSRTSRTRASTAFQGEHTNFSVSAEPAWTGGAQFTIAAPTKIRKLETTACVGFWCRRNEGHRTVEVAARPELP